MPIRDKDLLGKYKKPSIFGYPDCPLCVKENKKQSAWGGGRMGWIEYNGEYYCKEHIKKAQRKEKLQKLNENSK